MELKTTLQNVGVWASLMMAALALGGYLVKFGAITNCLTTLTKNVGELTERVKSLEGSATKEASAYIAKDEQRHVNITQQMAAQQQQLNKLGEAVIDIANIRTDIKGMAKDVEHLKEGLTEHMKKTQP